MTRNDYDVWHCSKCDKRWVTPSVPHTSKCPTCGTFGWWQHFEYGEYYDVD